MGVISGYYGKMEGEINLTISAININSFNVSTLGGESNKTFLKI